MTFAPKVVYFVRSYEPASCRTRMDQATLTQYYSTRKRPVEGVNPSKRRKLIETDDVVTFEVQSGRESARITRQRSKTTGLNPTRVIRTRKARTKNVVKTTGDSKLQAFLGLGIKELTDESVEVVSEVTSIEDDHESDMVKETPSLDRASTRRRKLQPKHAGNGRDTKQSDAEIIEKTKEKTVSKVGRGKRSQNPEVKESHTISNEVQKIQESESVGKNSTEEAKINEDRSTSTKNQIKSKQSIMVPEKSPVRSNSSGLKINPWIAEQANKVLLSRGQAALLMSHQKKADSQQKSSSRGKDKKSVAEKNGLSMTKAQEGLEKARELIKKMRSLESDFCKPKETSTTGTSERLHKLAKRQTTEGVPDGSVSSSKRAPAHERFHSLAQPSSSSSEATVILPLPYKHKVLGEMFTSCDTILNLLGQRKESCTFDKLKESVQQMCRKRFEKSHLAQMSYVYPACYDLQQVRSSAKSSSYQLTIQFGPAKNSTDGRLTIPAAELLSRKKSFQDKLLTLTKKHHQTFLKSLDTPLSIDDDKIIRWHPQFRLDDVPDIEQITLPEPPVIKTFTSAQDVLDKGRGFLAPKVEKALKNTAMKTKEKSKIEITYDSQPKLEESNSKMNNIKVNNALKGVSQDLLNKIRQKEARKLEEKLMRDPVLDKKMVMQERLPDLCRILKTYFTTEKKAAIPLEDAAVKLSESYKSSLTPGQVEEHLNLLSEIAPEWISLLMVRKCLYVKINRKTDINSVIKKVTQIELK